MKASTGFSLAALIFAIIGAFTPIVGFWIGVLALGLAAVGGYLGDRGLTIATISVSIVAFLFMTPMLWIEAAADAVDNTDQSFSGFRWLAFGAVALPIVAMILGSKRSNT